MGLSWPDREADEKLDYEVDWTKWLEGDTIVTSAFSFITQAGLAIDSQNKTANVSIVWLTGGTPGLQGVLKCSITTAAGRIKDEIVSINIT